MHQRLRQIQSALPEVQSIWIFGPTGHPQVMTRETPALTYQDFSAVDYFTVPRDGPPGIYIGGVHQSVSGGQPYFTFNQARRDADGKFAGVIEMSLLGSDFRRFYSRLVSGGGLQFAMVREDGTMLARFPPAAGDVQLGERSGFHRSLVAAPANGFYTSAGENDNVERRVGVPAPARLSALCARRHRYRPDQKRLDERHGVVSHLRHTGDRVAVRRRACGAAKNAAPLRRTGSSRGRRVRAAADAKAGRDRPSHRRRSP